jgi:polyisoprenoid-binding protein YceI
MNTLRMTSVTALLLLSGGSALAGEWELDASHTTVQFNVKHMMVTNVHGQFQKASGTVSLDERDPTHSTIEVTIDPASVDTREPKRDAHLRSPDFFDVAKYPTITFKSTRVEKADGGRLKATGDLTLHGVTKAVTLLVEPISAAVKNPWGMLVRGVSASGKLSRKDFGLTWNKALDAGGVLVGDEVQLQIDAELVAKAQKHASN